MRAWLRHALPFCSAQQNRMARTAKKTNRSVYFIYIMSNAHKIRMASRLFASSAPARAEECPQNRAGLRFPLPRFFLPRFFLPRVARFALLRASSAGIALPPAAEQGKEAKKRESPDRTVLDSFQQNKKRSKVNPLSLFNSLLLRFFFFCATQNRIARSALPRSAKAGQAKKRIVARRK